MLDRANGARLRRRAAVASAALALTAAGATLAHVATATTWHNQSVPSGTSTMFSYQTPETPNSTSTQARVNGVRFTSSVAGYVSGVRFFKGSQNTGTHVGSLWTAAGSKLASATFTNETSDGWQQVTFAKPVAVKASTVYVAGFSTNSHWSYTRSGLASAQTNGSLTALGGSFVDGTTGFPTHWSTTNYYADVLFSTTSIGSAPAASPSSTPSSTPSASASPTSPTSPAASPTPAASPKATATPTATATATSAPAPSTGWPGPSNTGVPAGTVLHSCPTTITVTGTYDKCQFNGSVSVKANNVTISRSLINGVVHTGSGSQQTGLYVVDTTINATGHGSSCASGCTTPPAVSYANFTLERVNVYGSGHGIQTNGHAVIKDSYIHDLCCSNKAHKDGIISNGGSYVTVQHNTVLCDVGPVGGGNYCSAALGLFGDFQPISHWNVINNFFNTTGSYCSYGGSIPAKKYPVATYVVFKDNHYGKKYYSSCGLYGPNAYFNSSYTGNVWSGNVWDGTTTAVKQ